MLSGVGGGGGGGALLLYGAGGETGQWKGVSNSNKQCNKGSKNMYPKPGGGGGGY